MLCSISWTTSCTRVHAHPCPTLASEAFLFRPVWKTGNRSLSYQPQIMDPWGNMSLTEVKRSRMNTGGQNLTHSILYFVGKQRQQACHHCRRDSYIHRTVFFFNISAFYLVLFQSFCSFSFDKVLWDRRSPENRGGKDVALSEHFPI